jgi:pimeloyl-ACP methyl ester carboxylesterase
VPARWATTRDGVKIAVHDLGGSGRPLLIAHATGFHGRAYQPFASELAARFHSIALDERGHGESGLPPVLDFDWNGFGLDVGAVVEANALSGAVAFGHSAGGAALLLAELADPGTFSALYLFEPIVFPFEAPQEPQPDGPLSVAARRRRESFESRDEAVANYAAKPPLNVLDRSALEAYVEHGFEDTPDGRVRLRCRRENEAQVYAMAPTLGIYSRLGEIGCPVTFAGGALTEAIARPHLELLAAQVPVAEVEVLPGIGHFGPLEKPRQVAASLVSAVGGAGSGG